MNVKNIVEAVKTNHIVQLILVLIIAFLLIKYVKPHFEKKEGLENVKESSQPKMKPEEITKEMSVAAVEKIADAAAAPVAAKPKMIAQLEVIANQNVSSMDGAMAVKALAEQAVKPEAEKPEVVMAAATTAAKSIVQPYSGDSDMAMVTPQEQKKQIDAVVAGTQQLKADDLLPKYDDANAFAKEQPVNDLLKEQNFLISGYHVGINTVLQSNKIPYLDIRSLPPIAKESVGPWNNSSYEKASGMRKGFEIGA